MKTSNNPSDYLDNQCIKLLTDLEHKHPNDADLGAEIRIIVRKNNLTLDDDNTKSNLD
jgi:hypothetical protein